MVLTPVARSHYVDYYSQTIYAWDIPLGAGYSYATSGWNTRTENAGCRSDNSGIMGLTYAQANPDVEVIGSDTLWTNCTTGTYVLLLSNGYYRSRCYNDGLVTFYVQCDSWNYHSD